MLRSVSVVCDAGLISGGARLLFMPPGLMALPDESRAVRRAGKKHRERGPLFPCARRRRCYFFFFAVFFAAFFAGFFATFLAPFFTVFFTATMFPSLRVG
jgi:hypothetical protein